MSPRRIAWATWAVSIVLVFVWVVLDALAQSSENDLGEYLFVVVAVVLYATVGALITSRQLGNRVGLVFSWVALIAAAGSAVGGYAALAAERTLPFLAAATWFARVGFAAMIGPLAFLFLIFPTGSPPSRRWGWLQRVMLVAYAVTIVLFAVTPGDMDAGFAEVPGNVDNPVGLSTAWQGPIEAATTAGGFTVFAGSVLSIVSLIQRYRRASASERQQIRWLALLGAVTMTFVLVMLSLDISGLLPEGAGDIPFFIMIFLVFLGIPITCAVAILKHGLWDLDVVVKKTVQYAVLLVATLAVIGLALIAPWLLAIGIPRELLPGMGLGLVVAAVFALLRPRAQRFANRIVYGKRSTPYEVLSAFTDRVGETYSTEDVLPRMAQLLGEATGARSARVWLRVGGVMRADAVWPAEAEPGPDVPSRGTELPDFGGDPAFEVRHQGELLGALTMTEAADDPMNPTKTKLVRDMASQAGLVLRNVRLIEDLRESRRRIVAAQDARAKKLERDIHDGAQQQLVALGVKQRLAASLVGKDEERLRSMLEDLQGETSQALEDLRDLARGIYPPLLADKGLAAALEGQARKSSVPVQVDPDGVGRYSQEVEAAVYFCCLEALQNVAKYAQANTVTVRLAQANGGLTFEVSDDGKGFDPDAIPRGSGLQGIADRLAALGGTFEIESGLGAGTTLRGRIPAPTGQVAR